MHLVSGELVACFYNNQEKLWLRVETKAGDQAWFHPHSCLSVGCKYPIWFKE